MPALEENGSASGVTHKLDNNKFLPHYNYKDSSDQVTGSIMKSKQRRNPNKKIAQTMLSLQLNGSNCLLSASRIHG